MLLFGLLIFIIVFGVAMLVYLSTLFLLPLYGIFQSEELSIRNRLLTIRSHPFKSEKTFDLEKLVKWEITSASGRYMWGRTIYLHLTEKKKVKQKILISEMQFKDFDRIVAYFDSAFGHAKIKS